MAANQISTAGEWQHILERIINGDAASTEADISDFFESDYTHNWLGKVELDFNGWVDHVSEMRKIPGGFKIKVNKFLRDGNQIASQHTIVNPHKTIEVFLFGKLSNNGKMGSIVESQIDKE